MYLHKIDSGHLESKLFFNISKEVIANYTKNISEVHAKGDSQLAQVFYLIHITDWVSWYLSDLKKVDASEVDVIHHLKSEMAKK